MARPAKQVPPGSTLLTSRPPMSEQQDDSREITLRVLCLESGCGTPTASQLRRLLGLQCAVDQVVTADRCEVAVYESPSWTAKVTLRLERPPKDSFMHIVLKWCNQCQDASNGGTAADKSGPPEWWLASEELEECCDPYRTKPTMEHKDVPVNAFALGCFLGYNTFVAHFDSAYTTPPPSQPPPSSSKSTPSPSGKEMSAKHRKKGKSKSKCPSPGTSAPLKATSSNNESSGVTLTSRQGLPEATPGVVQSVKVSPTKDTIISKAPGQLGPSKPSAQDSARRPLASRKSSSPSVSQRPTGTSLPSSDLCTASELFATPRSGHAASCKWSSLLVHNKASVPTSPHSSSETKLSGVSTTPSTEDAGSQLPRPKPPVSSCAASSSSKLHTPSLPTRSVKPSASAPPSQPAPCSEGFKVTQCKAHFEHSSSELYLYFVDVRKRSSTVCRLLVRYSTICRIVLRKTSPTATTVYLQLLHPPLLYKVCAGNSATSQCNREGDYLPQFDLSDTTPWDRAVEFGEGPLKCSADVLGRSRVMRLTLCTPRHWASLCNLILRTRNNAQVFYAPVRELQAREFKVVAKPSIPDFGVTYALISVWSESFQVSDELALDPQSCRDTVHELAARAKECPRALEEALFEVYFSLSEGKVFWFRTALERLYLRYRAHRNRTDAFTGSIIAQDLPSHMVMVRKVILTPTRRVYLPPQLVCKSRLLQHFDPDYALRIVVRDDDCKLISFSLGACKDDFLSAVIKPPLSSGLKIGGRRFMFLGCSTSQLRNHGVWFYAHDTLDRTAAHIRDGIGDLSAIHSVPKFMARLGQAFSQSLGLLTVPSQNTTVEPDIRHTAPGCSGDGSQSEYTFSDGIGRISHALLRKVHQALELEEGEEPCAVQIRYGGCKGMLMLDPTLSGRRIVFRESMRKFYSDHEDLFVLKTSKPRVLYLNRPMITILDQSNIKAKVFLTLQNRILDTFIDSMMDPHEAAQVLCAYCALRLPYKELAGVGIDLTVEPFFRALVRAVNRKVLSE